MTISYIVCSHRAPASLNATLQCLAKEQVRVPAEVVLVNNGFCAEREREISDFFVAGGGRLTGHIVKESKPGLGFARLKGFSEAKGEFLVLLDDDNTLAQGFSEKLLDAIAAYPHCGAICPLVFPRWDGPIPNWLTSVGALCLSYNRAAVPKIDELAKEWTRAHKRDAVRSPGGGMILHRDVVTAYVVTAQGKLRASLGRTGDDLGGSEDEDIFRHLWLTGRTAVLYPGLHVFHHIPTSRTELKYLLRLNFAMTRSYVRLEKLSRTNLFKIVFRYGVYASFNNLRLGVISAMRFKSFSPLLVHGARALGGWAGITKI